MEAIMQYRHGKKVRFPWLMPVLLATPILLAGSYALFRWGSSLRDLLEIALKMVVKA